MRANPVIISHVGLPRLGKPFGLNLKDGVLIKKT
jgi:hypothetical protein